MNERDKIIEIVIKTKTKIAGISLQNMIGGGAMASDIADALLANGIGDVTAWKRRSDLAESLRNIYWRSLNIIEKEVKVASEMTREAAAREIEEEKSNGEKKKV